MRPIISSALVTSLVALLLAPSRAASEKPSSSASRKSVRGHHALANPLPLPKHRGPLSQPGTLSPVARKAKSVRLSPRALSAAKALKTTPGPRENILWSLSDGTPATLKGPFGEKNPQKPRRIASDFLKRHHRLFSLKGDLSDLTPAPTTESSAGYHVSFQQLCNGVPVEGATIKVHLLKDGRIHSLKSHLSSHLNPDTDPRLSQQQAIDIACRHLHLTGDLRGDIQAELVILPQSPPGVLAWKVSIPAAQPRGDWVLMVHAREGTVLSARDIRVFATGQGKVFDPNPVVTLETTALSDQDDSASAIPQEAYSTVTLEDLDNTGYLRGPYVDTALTAYRAFSADLDFSFDRSQSGFEEVMIYYHIQQFQKYLQNDLGVVLGTRQVLADAHLSDEDNSWFSPLIRAIYFGDGGVDDGEEAHLILHEYVHAIAYDVLRETPINPEASAMNEGAADYLAASFFADRAFMPETFAPWDGIANVPIGVRRVDSNKVYPTDMTGESHDDGEIWSSALWHMREAVGATIADTLLAESIHYLDGSSLFTDGLEALLQADDALYAAAHADDINSSFAARGILVHSSLQIGETRQAILGKGDLTMPDGSYYDHYSFSATADQVLRINMESSEFDTYLILLDPFFNTIAQGDDLANASTNSQILLTIPYSGTYHILANAFSEDHTGQYSLTLSQGALADGTPQTTSIAFGIPVPGHLGGGDFDLTDGTYYDEYDLSGHVGQQITVSMTSSETDAYLILYDAEFNLLALDDDSGGGTNALLTFTLTYDGEFVLAANQAYRGSGRYTLSLTSSDPQIPLDTIVSGTLSEGDLEMSADGSYFDPFQFQGTAGQSLSFMMFSSQLDPYLLLYDPYFKIIADMDDTSRDNINAVLEELILPIPGTYFLIANSFSAGETGDYKLALTPTSTTDADADGFSDRTELAQSTNPLDPASTPPDADGDFIPDSADPDADNDGMPNLWELSHGFLPLDSSDGGKDADLDGRSNFAEFLAGTNPHDPASFFRVLSILPAPDGVTLRWNGCADRRYAVYRSVNLTGWTLLQTDIASQGDVTTWTAPHSPDQAAFYHVETLQLEE